MKVIKQMRNVVADVMTSQQSDFEKYDCHALQSDPQFPYIWVVGKSHTYLLSLGDFESRFNRSESVRLAYAQGNDGGYNYCVTSHKSDHLFLLTGANESLQRINVQQAQEIIRDTMIPVVHRWETEHGKLPKRCKVQVKFHDISLSQLKHMIDEDEKYGGTLLRCLHGFHHWQQYCIGHHVDLWWNERYQEFSFNENKNGVLGLIGAIVFHGYPDTGYISNGSVQLEPEYGWAMHT